MGCVFPDWSERGHWITLWAVWRKQWAHLPRRHCALSALAIWGLSSLGSFYDFDERNKTPFKGTERAINQKTALQTVLRYTDGLKSFITLLMNLVCLQCFTAGEVSRVICIHFFPSQCIYSRHKSPPINGDSWGKSGPVILQPRLFNVSNSTECQRKTATYTFSCAECVWLPLHSQGWKENSWSCTPSLTCTGLPVSGTIIPTFPTKASVYLYSKLLFYKHLQLLFWFYLILDGEPVKILYIEEATLTFICFTLQTTIYAHKPGISLDLLPSYFSNLKIIWL